jgi:hypothetical protein
VGWAKEIFREQDCNEYIWNLIEREQSQAARTKQQWVGPAVDLRSIELAEYRSYVADKPNLNQSSKWVREGSIRVQKQRINYVLRFLNSIVRLGLAKKNSWEQDSNLGAWIYLQR